MNLIVDLTKNIFVFTPVNDKEMIFNSVYPLRTFLRFKIHESQTLIQRKKHL